MNAFTIKDLENLSGVKAHTIRIWEQRYSFLKPQRTGTNIRYYSNEELKVILNIALLNKFGYKISHIDKMNVEEITKNVESLSHKEAYQERLVNELITYMIDLEMEAFEQVLDSQIKTKGIETIITEIIFPFLEKVGILWLTNHINPSQEHLVTNIIRQKLVVGIENTPLKAISDKSVLLFLPEGEHHELGLLYVHYLIKSRGIKAYYLGADVPLSDLVFVVKTKNPTCVYSHLTAGAPGFNFEKFIHHLHSRIPESPIVISGSVTHDYKKELPSNVLLKKSVDEVLEYLTKDHSLVSA
jgi:DNA-binding transcriptional MerR regulator